MEVEIKQAKRDLSKLIKAALAGEDVVITDGGKPLVRIVPAQPKAPEPRDKDRGYGSLKGKLTMPTEEEWKQADRAIEDLFYGREPRKR